MTPYEHDLTAAIRGLRQQPDAADAVADAVEIELAHGRAMEAVLRKMLAANDAHDLAWLVLLLREARELIGPTETTR